MVQPLLLPKFVWGILKMPTIGSGSRVVALARGAVVNYINRQRRCALALLLASAMITPAWAEASSRTAAAHHHARQRPSATSEAKHQHSHGSAAETKHLERLVGPRTLPEDGSTFEESRSAPQLPPDFAVIGLAIELVRHRKFTEADTLAATINDPVARNLVEWAFLRDSDNPASFDRYNIFIQANADWPSLTMLRRRAEARLWQERRNGTTARRFLGGQPTSALGRLALARALQSEGDRTGAEREVRAVWQSAEMSAELEAAVAKEFPEALTPSDDLARMDYRIGAKDFGAAMRSAKRLGAGRAAIVKACATAEAHSTKSSARLEEVAEELRGDLGFALCRLHWLLARDNVAAAVNLVTELPPEGLEHQNVDEWWRERRLLARKLIDLGDARTAYRVVSDATLPANPYYRAEQHFMAGWIALRFLNNPNAALANFIHVDDGLSDPIVLARAAYWRGRTAEATGQFEEMRAQYRAAAAYPTAYYGQLARARLGLNQADVLSSSLDDGRDDLLHAADILYAIGEYDLVLLFVGDLAETSMDTATLKTLGELAARHNDAPAMLAIGKTALARGLPMELHAFPGTGIPSYTPIAPPIDRCVVYSIVRTESAFDQRDRSSANAVGLMQITSEAGRDTAKRFGVAYDWKRLVSDPVYNTQIGTAELSALLKEYTGSYIMTFAAYNAGRGRVRQWIAQHGDPRDPKVDAVDWVERIPIAETRNYVQRVMESLQVYGARFGSSVATVEPNLHRTANIGSIPKPFWVEVTP
jgi:peptidoglycan lytic transglycosylase